MNYLHYIKYLQFKRLVSLTLKADSTFIKQKTHDKMSNQQAAAANNSDSDLDLEENTSNIDQIYHRCRFYRNKMPQVGDITKVVTTQLMELGANVQLLEYGNIEGFI